LQTSTHTTELSSPITSYACPAKLNLFLHFIGQRSDGYHLLQSYFQLLDFGDELQISITDDRQISFSCDQSRLNCDNLNTSDNLVVKAAKLLQKQTQTIQGARLHLIKKLPVGGGVGGGSSDCATALIALNRLWNTGLDLDELTILGNALGADVPVFIHGKSSFVEGTGEIITPYPLPPAYFLVIQPNSHISTGEIFSNPLLTRNSKAITIRDLKTLGLPFEGVNTMQPIVVEANKEVKYVLDWLKSHSSTARMTGSGSCLFSVFDNLEEASKIAAQCDSSWLTFVARGTTQSELHKKLDYAG